MPDPFAAAAASAARLAELTGQARHDVAVVLGSGWAQAADALASGLDAAVPRSRSPTSAVSRRRPCPVTPGRGPVHGDAGLRVLVFLGRIHLYEGHPAATVVHGVRTAVAAGCRVVVLTNASGGIAAGLPGRASRC